MNRTLERNEYVSSNVSCCFFFYSLGKISYGFFTTQEYAKIWTLPSHIKRVKKLAETKERDTFSMFEIEIWGGGSKPRYVPFDDVGTLNDETSIL